MAISIRIDSTSAHGTPTKNGKATMSAESLKAHIDRKGNYAKQENVDPTKTTENYSLDDWDDSKSYYDRAQELRETAGINKKRDFRKGTAFCASFVVTASQEEMESLSADEQRAYFDTAKEWLDDYFGEDVLLYADVHMDEKTPHLHIGYVPINEDTRNMRWDSKIQKTTMSQHFQQELPQALRDSGFDFEMPKDKAFTEAEHVSPKAYRKIEKAYKSEIKDDLKKDVEDNFILKYKVKRKKEVDDQIIDDKKTMLNDLAKKQADAIALRAQINALEAHKKFLDEELKDNREKRKKSLEELSELENDIADSKEVKRTAKALEDVFLDTGTPEKLAKNFAKGNIVVKKDGTRVHGNNYLRSKMITMSRSKLQEFERKQITRINESTAETSTDDLEP